jgi:hypothetical protein
MHWLSMSIVTMRQLNKSVLFRALAQHQHNFPPFYNFLKDAEHTCSNNMLMLS